MRRTTLAPLALPLLRPRLPRLLDGQGPRRSTLPETARRPGLRRAVTTLQGTPPFAPPATRVSHGDSFDRDDGASASHTTPIMVWRRCQDAGAAGFSTCAGEKGPLGGTKSSGERGFGRVPGRGAGGSTACRGGWWRRCRCNCSRAGKLGKAARRWRCAERYTPRSRPHPSHWPTLASVRTAGDEGPLMDQEALQEAQRLYDNRRCVN